MSKYLFQLGQNPQLSLLELRTVAQMEVEQVNDYIVSLDLEDETAAVELFSSLGGSVKLFSLIKQLEFNQTQDNLEKEIVDCLLDSGKKSFAIAELGRDHLPALDAKQIKNLVKEQGINLRYIESSRHGLSAAVLLHKSNLIELVLIQSDDQLFLAKTLLVQDIDQWSKRDRSKPYFDRKKGMLPPKVARIMLNLAMVDKPAQNLRIYDPFCGTGTVLLEALASGITQVIGSDIDENSVIGTQRNIEWFLDEKQRKADFNVFKKDVSQVTLSDVKQEIDLIVTEPFLGRQTPTDAFLPKMFLGLEKLYLGAFKKWTNILSDQAHIVIIFPLVNSGKRTYNLDKLIDKLANLGYTLYLEPIVYQRPNARVKRQIMSFKYNKLKTSSH